MDGHGFKWQVQKLDCLRKWEVKKVGTENRTDLEYELDF